MHDSVYIVPSGENSKTIAQSKRLSLDTSQVTNQTEADPCFSSVKRLEVFLLPLGWDASPPQGYPQH